ncbi:hypothetical protein [Bradyrhizobium sp.]|jgi:hypothetical protein|uniref:hypothetical protein n=1 Tax=Bradyrhizobium sp. TaxID=376 RepID=UPI003C1EAA2A
MPIAGQGMLLTSMDVDAAHEADFNRWYDREHLEERVAIPGFVEARRYIAIEGSMPKYLSPYSTETFEVLDSPAYRKVLASQTAWSRENIARFKNMIRCVARITISKGTGRGAVLGIIRVRPANGGYNKLREALRAVLNPQATDGVISMHVIENDPVLSKPLTDKASDSDLGAGDWFVLIDATEIAAARDAVMRLTDNIAFKPLVVSSGVYRLLWDIAKADISAEIS